ncbi:TRAP transporter small permease [Bacillus sp. FJAT-29814]|uniref:TRAP transporter small permease n=1 Tax=Bacillus sp. FJAT-29814 TaxID=1729688 RepID=UPI0008316C13|nr:TRAP transporter small permease [Bacillus sp. FJAT-29814]
MLKKSLRFAVWLQEYFLIVSIVIMTIAAALQVLYRYVFELPQSGFEEIARYLMVASTFIGVGLAVEKKEHIRLDFLETLLAGHPRANKWINNINHIIVAIFSLIMTFLGYQLFVYSLKANQHSIGANLPLAWFKATVMIGFALSFIHSVGHLVNSIKKTEK